MIVDCISDLHGFYPKLDGGDLLIVAGDLTAHDHLHEYFECFDWIQAQKYKKKIVIAGNHDMAMEKEEYRGPAGEVADAFTYLCDSGTEFEGFHIWGSPWSLTFDNINPKCTAFTCTEKQIKSRYDKIPDNTDILVTHGPPWTMLDKTVAGNQVGSTTLTAAIHTRLKGKLKLHVFGHIHESYGKTLLHHQHPDTFFVNASHVNINYNPVNPPIRIIL